MARGTRLVEYWGIPMWTVARILRIGDGMGYEAMGLRVVGNGALAVPLHGRTVFVRM